MPGYPCSITRWFSGSVYILPEYFLFLSLAIPEILLYKTKCLESVSLLIIISYFISNPPQKKRKKKNNSLINILFNNLKKNYKDFSDFSPTNFFSLAFPHFFQKSLFPGFPGLSEPCRSINNKLNYPGFF